MNAYPEKQQYTADDLAAIIAILRDPENGCPWDKVQTHTSIRMNFLEDSARELALHARWRWSQKSYCVMNR